MKIVNAAYATKILREIDLAKIQREASRRFGLLVAGDAHLAAALTQALPPDGPATGPHPWLRSAAPGGDIDLDGIELALIVRSSPDVGAQDRALRERLIEAGIPALTVMVGSETSQANPVGLVQTHEPHRVVLNELSPAELERALAPALLEAAPADLRLPLARQHPTLRPTYARRLIEETARANALYTASTGLAAIVPILNIPLNVADTLVLTKNQLLMAFKLALAGGKEGRPLELIGEIVGVLGGGMLFRQIARELVGLLPVIGIVPNIAVSYAGTRLIGQSVHLWVAQGKRLEPAELRGNYELALAAGRRLARALVEQGRELAKKRRTGLPAGQKALPAPDDPGTPAKQA